MRCKECRNVILERGRPGCFPRRAPPLALNAAQIACTMPRRRVVSREDGACQLWKPVRKDFPRTGCHTAKEFFHGKQETNRLSHTGKFERLSAIVTMDSVGRG